MHMTEAGESVATKTGQILVVASLATEAEILRLCRKGNDIEPRKMGQYLQTKPAGNSA